MADRRVRRTRAALRDAMGALMVEKGYESVTVQDLIERADIGRSTFYSHYADKSELLDEMLADLRTELERDPGTGSVDRRRPLRFSLPMLRHVQEEQGTVRAVLGRRDGRRVAGEIEAMLLRMVGADLRTLAEAGDPLRVPLDLVASSVVSAFVATLTWWVADDFRRTPEEMDLMFQTLVAPGVRAAIPPPAGAGDHGGQRRSRA
ncbi:TetR/AcrR family transcriptional regulator [Cellulomonas sp. URHB0016]